MRLLGFSWHILVTAHLLSAALTSFLGSCFLREQVHDSGQVLQSPASLSYSLSEWKSHLRPGRLFLTHVALCVWPLNGALESL